MIMWVIVVFQYILLQVTVHMHKTYEFHYPPAQMSPAQLYEHLIISAAWWQKLTYQDWVEVKHSLTEY